MDPEYNFLLQIRGTKELHVFDGSDRSILSERELEEFSASGGTAGHVGGGPLRRLMHVGHQAADQNDEPGGLQPDEGHDKHREARIEGRVTGRTSDERGEGHPGEFPEDRGGDPTDDGRAQLDAGARCGCPQSCSSRVQRAWQRGCSALSRALLARWSSGCASRRESQTFRPHGTALIFGALFFTAYGPSFLSLVGSQALPEPYSFTATALVTGWGR